MNPAAKNVQLGDLTQRLNLRNELQCHSFKWFLDHIYTDHSLQYNVLYTGQIQHKVSQDCWDVVGSKSKNNCNERLLWIRWISNFYTIKI